MQQGRQNPSEHDDPAALARALEPALRATCQDHLLGDIEWFTATWQRGGAATGNAVWHDDDGELPVIIKLPVGGAELQWTRLLGDHGNDRDVLEGEVPHPTPRVLRAGGDLGGYDLGWIVIEKLEGKAVGTDLSAASLTGLIRAAVEFQRRAQESESRQGHVKGRTDDRDWEGLIAGSRQAVRNNAIHEEQRWNEAIKHTQRLLPDLLEQWSLRPTSDWCHGDLHPGNALHMPGDGAHPDRCVLIDLGLVHRGHWVEDAVYLERVFWGHEDKLSGVEPVKAMRAERKRRGLRVRERDGRLANIKRVLTAACVPARLAGEGGDAAYLHAALDRLERLLPTI